MTAAAALLSPTEVRQGTTVLQVQQQSRAHHNVTQYHLRLTHRTGPASQETVLPNSAGLTPQGLLPGLPATHISFIHPTVSMACHQALRGSTLCWSVRTRSPCRLSTSSSSTTTGSSSTLSLPVVSGAYCPCTVVHRSPACMCQTYIVITRLLLPRA